MCSFYFLSILLQIAIIIIIPKILIKTHTGLNTVVRHGHQRKQMKREIIRYFLEKDPWVYRRDILQNSKLLYYSKRSSNYILRMAMTASILVM